MNGKRALVCSVLITIVGAVLSSELVGDVVPPITPFVFNGPPHFQLRQELKTQSLGLLDKIQSKFNEKGLVCMPGSIAYNGTCIYFSHRKEKLSWLHAERFCRRLPLNSSLLVIQNDHQYETIREGLVQLRNKEQPQDQLVFYVGFKHKDYVWSWNNNITLDESNLTLSEYWSDWDGSHGDCGSLALLRNNKLIMRSTPCMSTSGRFICQYILNPCFQNDACGRYGRCINLYTKFVCDCSDSIFFEGKYCKEFSSNSIQAIVGSIIVILILLVLFVFAPCFAWFYANYISEEKEGINENNTNSRIRLKQAYITEAKGSDLYDKTLINIESAQRNDPELAAINEYKKENDKNFKPRKFGDKMSTMFKKFYNAIKIKVLGNATVYERFLSVALFLLLVALQVLFIHNVIDSEMFYKLKNLRKQYPLMARTCGILEGPYMSEELIIFPFSILMYTALWMFHKPARFSKRIMLKFRTYFKSKTYLEIRRARLAACKEAKKSRLEKMRQTKFGECRTACHKWYYSDHRILRFVKELFCALCCCSCCVPPASNTRCCCLYICCLGWHQTDCYKLLSKIRSFFSFLCCCCIWKRICQVVSKKREESKKKKRQERLDKFNDLIYINEVEDDVNEDEFKDDQTFHNAACPLPASPFSTTNRAQSAAIYIAFAYDIVNIFTSLYTKITQLPFLKVLGHQASEGVLFTIAYQLVHVFIVGIKYYPILIITDINASPLFYFASFLYMLVIFSVRFFTKSFCSRSEAFIKIFYNQISEQYGQAFSLYWQNRYNMSNKVLAMFTDEDDSNKKYMSDLKNRVPKLFKRIFGRYESSDPDESPGSLEMQQTRAPDFESLLTADELSTQEIFVTSTVTSEDYFASTPQMFYNQINDTYPTYSYRERFKNKTSEKFDKVLGFFGTRDKSSELAFQVLENLPLYITLAYLLSRYFLIFLEKLISKLSCMKKRKPHAKSSRKRTKTKKDAKSNNDSMDTATTNSFDETTPNSNQTLIEPNKLFQDNSTSEVNSLYGQTTDTGDEGEGGGDDELNSGDENEKTGDDGPRTRTRLANRIKDGKKRIGRHLHSGGYDKNMEDLDNIWTDGKMANAPIIDHLKRVQDIIRRISDPLQEEKYIREGHVHIGENHNYLYIKELLAYQKFFDDVAETPHSNVVIKLPDDETEPAGQANLLKIHQSRPTRVYKISTFNQFKRIFANLFKRYYNYVPHMKYSKQFVNTYVVAFMLLFFFTMFSLRLSNIFGNSIILVFSTLYKFLLKGVLPSIDWTQYDFMYEFRIASILSSSVIFVQLLLSISNFHTELKELHCGKSKLKKVDYSTYNPKLDKEKRKASIQITSDSLHFPGYLVAHIVYGYVIFFLIAFVISFFFRVISMAPGLSSRLFINYLLPILVMVSIKVVFFKFLTRFYFLAGDGQRMTNPTPYHVSSYFNFFLDCFLGLVACLSRIWETTIVSIILLPRLDKSIFNNSQETLMKRLDKGHIAYLNYLRMEHWYNNPVLNGFCEIMIESMFHSQMYRGVIENYSRSKITAAKISKSEALNSSSKIILAPYHQASPKAITSQPQSIDRMVSFQVDSEAESPPAQADTAHYIRLTRTLSTTPSTGDRSEHDTLQNIYLRSESRQETKMVIKNLAKKPNPNFNFKSYLRLRNIFYLCLFLQKNPSLKKWRYHCIKDEIEMAKAREESQKIPDIWSNMLFKIKEVKKIGFSRQRRNSS